MSEEITHKGITIRIQQDEDPMNPRSEFSNLGKMVCFHKQYNLGDKHNWQSEDYAGWDEMEAAIRKQEKVAVILPLFLMDHSGLSMRCSSDTFRACDSAGWDWGQVGFIYVAREDVLKEYGKVTRATLKQAEQVLRGEVEVYDQYLTGDIWGYTVDPDGEDESLWGMFGYEYCVQEAKDVAERIAARSQPSIYMSV